jgi:hypothetical protein
LNALYDEILEITREYMGIVAEAFIKRRCQNSLDLDDPFKLTVDDLELFAKGVSQTGEIYMKPEKVKQFATDLMKLRDRYQSDKKSGIFTKQNNQGIQRLHNE